MERLLRTQEACRFYRVSASTLLRWRQSKKLVALRTPGGTLRYRPSDIEKALKEEPVAV